mgnify:CR=1 FL=1
MTDFGETINPTARKDHKCEWCGGKIAKGEVHCQFKGKWQGEFQNWRMHDECYENAEDSDSLQDGFTMYEHGRPE